MYLGLCVYYICHIGGQQHAITLLTGLLAHEYDLRLGSLLGMT